MLLGIDVSLFVIVNVPMGICNIIAGVMYVVLCYIFLKLFVEKGLKLGVEEFGMPKFGIRPRWILVAVLLPCVGKWFCVE